MSKKLIELRGERSRKTVAAILGITSQGLAMIERGERFPRPALLKKISDYYQTSIDEIFFSSEDEKFFDHK